MGARTRYTPAAHALNFITIGVVFHRLQHQSVLVKGALLVYFFMHISHDVLPNSTLPMFFNNIGFPRKSIPVLWRAQLTLHPISDHDAKQ